MLTEALKLLGIKELVGKGSNPLIMDWVKELNTAKHRTIVGYTDDSIAWCGLWMAIVAYRRLNIIDEVVKDPLWARNWLNYGVASPKPELGDILVFLRTGGGHVGLYVGEDDECYHVLGGNQKNEVKIIRILRSRLLGARRPKYYIKPKSVKAIRLSNTGVISENEK